MNTIDLDTVFALPVPERIRLVEAIWDSVAKEGGPAELLSWQADELDRRLADFERSPAEGSPWPEVKRQILGAG